MDVSNIIKNLHPLETKVLLRYSQKDDLTAEKLQKDLDYKEGHANQAFSWLSGKELCIIFACSVPIHSRKENSRRQER